MEELQELIACVRAKQLVVNEMLDKSDEAAMAWHHARRAADAAILERDRARMALLDATLGSERVL